MRRGKQGEDMHRAKQDSIPTKLPECEIRLVDATESEEIFALIDRNRLHLSRYDELTSRKYPTLRTVVQSFTKPKQPEKLRYGIWVREVLAGTVNLLPVPELQPKVGIIGYWLGEEFCGRGYATAAAETLMLHARRGLGFKEFAAQTHPDNTPSHRVLTRLGFAQGKRDGATLYWYWTPPAAP